MSNLGNDVTPCDFEIPLDEDSDELVLLSAKYKRWCLKFPNKVWAFNLIQLFDQSPLEAPGFGLGLGTGGGPQIKSSNRYSIFEKNKSPLKSNSKNVLSNSTLSTEAIKVP